MCLLLLGECNSPITHGLREHCLATAAAAAGCGLLCDLYQGTVQMAMVSANNILLINLRSGLAVFTICTTNTPFESHRSPVNNRIWQTRCMKDLSFQHGNADLLSRHLNYLQVMCASHGKAGNL